MIWRLCLYPGCTRLTEKGGYCREHRELSEKRRAERARKLFTRRESSAPYNHLYRTAAWRKLRAEFLRLHPFCVRCGKPAVIADHITPHKGRPELFFCMENLQAMCQSCHSAKTLAENGYFRRDR